MSRNPRVLIADDHPAIREGVRAAMAEGGFDVCAAVSTADAAIASAITEQPDVCLLDISMPGNGLRAVGAITTALPSAVVLVLTVSESSDDLVDALRAGAAGYLLKNIDPQRLPAMVRAALDGEFVIPRELTARLVERVRTPSGRTRIIRSDGTSIELTNRGWEVLELLAEGLSTNEMAERLFLRNITVRRHLSDVMHKLRVTNRSAAVELFRQRPDARA